MSAHREASETTLNVQITPDAAAALEERVSLGLAADCSEMALTWLRRWSYKYLDLPPDPSCVGHDTVTITIVVDPGLLRVLQHYASYSAEEIAAAVISAEGQYRMDRKKRDPQIMEGRFDFRELDM